LNVAFYIIIDLENKPAVDRWLITRDDKVLISPLQLGNCSAWS